MWRVAVVDETSDVEHLLHAQRSLTAELERERAAHKREAEEAAEERAAAEVLLGAWQAKTIAAAEAQRTQLLALST